MKPFFDITRKGSFYYASRMGQPRFRIGRKKGLGMRHFGKLKPSVSITTAEDLPYLLAVSREEGVGFDGVNTWHPGDCSFGSFQWNYRSGDFGQLLARLRQSSPHFFRSHFVEFGVELGSGQHRYALFYEGQHIDRDAPLLRSEQFAALVCHAAQHVEYQHAEIEHARARLTMAERAACLRARSTAGKALLLSSHLLLGQARFTQLARQTLGRCARERAHGDLELRFLHAFTQELDAVGYRLRTARVLRFLARKHDDPTARLLLARVEERSSRSQVHSIQADKPSETDDVSGATERRSSDVNRVGSGSSGPSSS